MIADIDSPQKSQPTKYPIFSVIAKIALSYVAGAKKEAIGIVVDYMKSQTKLLGASVENKQLEQFSESLVEDTYKQMKFLR